MQSEWPNVEQLIALAKNNPDALERFRSQQIEKLIASAPEAMQRRLRGLQFQIDCKRKIHKSSMGACIALSKMMFDSVYELNDALQGLQQTETTSAARRPRTAAIIPITRAV